MSAIYVTDPATGESVTLSELARRHDIHVSSLSVRYREGRRGQALVEKTDQATRMAEQNARIKAAVERRETILTASAFGLTRPLNLIAEAGKMVGGAQ